MAMISKQYRVIKKSHINNAIRRPGEVITITYDERKGFTPGDNLQEIKNPEPPRHSDAQKKAADEAAAMREAAQPKAEEEPEAEAPKQPRNSAK